MVSTGEPEKCDTVAPDVESIAVRSKIEETARIPAGTAALDDDTVTLVALTTSPGPNVTVATPSELAAAPPLVGSIVPAAGGERPLPGTEAGSVGVEATPAGWEPRFESVGAVVVEGGVEGGAELTDVPACCELTPGVEPSDVPPPDALVDDVPDAVPVTVVVVAPETAELVAAAICPVDADEPEVPPLPVPAVGGRLIVAGGSTVPLETVGAAGGATAPPVDEPDVTESFALALPVPADDESVESGVVVVAGVGVVAVAVLFAGSEDAETAESRRSEPDLAAGDADGTGAGTVPSASGRPGVGISASMTGVVASDAGAVSAVGAGAAAGAAVEYPDDGAAAGAAGGVNASAGGAPTTSVMTGSCAAAAAPLLAFFFGVGGTTV